MSGLHAEDQGDLASERRPADLTSGSNSESAPAEAPQSPEVINTGANSDETVPSSSSSESNGDLDI